jgi:hypothetical protein
LKEKDVEKAKALMERIEAIGSSIAELIHGKADEPPAPPRE